MKLVASILVVIGIIIGSWQTIKYVNQPINDPEQLLDELTESLKDNKYDQMYQLIYQNTSKENRFSKTEFVHKYESIFQGLSLKNTQIDDVNLTYKEDEKYYEATYTATFATFLGNIESTYKTKIVQREVDKKNKWFVEWSPSLIFPQMSYGDKISAQTIMPIRGEIVDRNNIPLAENGYVYQLGIVPELLDSDKEKNIQQISSFFHVPIEKIHAALAQKWIKPQYFVPIAIMPEKFNPTYYNEDIPAVSFMKKDVRHYPLGEGAAHLIGYVKGITKEDLDNDKENYYSANDWIGKAGLEATYEKQLRGEKGGYIRVLNKNGEVKATIKEVKAIDGQDVQLTISSDLQSNLYANLKEEAGAVSAMNPKTGELLALVSYPSFNPNLMVTGMSVEQWKEYSENPKLPFLNRFTSMYAPGSVFKALTASIGIETGISYPNKTHHINGLQWKKDSSWGGYYVTRVNDRSSVNLYDALALSDNIYFAKEALEMGASVFEDKVYKFGFQTDFQLPLNLQKSQLSNKGIHGEVLLADSSYGQGEVLMSPIHIGVAFTPFLNDGHLVMPHLILGEKRDETDQIISAKTVQIINKGLRGVVSRSDGTARGLNSLPKQMAAKTGTAELKQKKGEDGLENGFLITYDLDSPQLLLTALVEDVKGRGGSQVVINHVKPALQSYLSFNAE